MTKANPKALKPVGKEGKAPQQHDKAKKANPKAPKPVGKEGKAPKPVKKGGGGATRQSENQFLQEHSGKVLRSGQKRTEKKGKKMATKAQKGSTKKRKNKP